jgi:hypothetical protein
LLSGIAGIKHSQVGTLPRTEIDPATGGIVKTSVPLIDTAGSALMKVATRDWIDWNNCITNDVQEVAATLGIIAARAVLFAEMNRVIRYDGGYVDPRHLWHVMAAMTHRGHVMKQNRFGLNRVDFGVFQRAAYEEPVMMMVEGAIGAEYDPMRGTCEAIMFGQKAPLGTGTVEIQVDIDAGAPPIVAPRVAVASREQDLLRGTRKHFREDLVNGGDGTKDKGTAHLRAVKLAASLAGPAPVRSRRSDGVLPLPSSLHIIRIAPDGVREVTHADGDFVPMSPQRRSGSDNTASSCAAVSGAKRSQDCAPGAQPFPAPAPAAAPAILSAYPDIGEASGGLRRLAFQPSSPSANDLYEIERIVAQHTSGSG